MGSKDFQSSMVIPPLPASFLNPCKCIYVSYFLQFVGEIQGFHLPAILNVPIVIGTIPLRDQFQNILATDMQVPSSPAAPGDVTNPSAPAVSNYPDLPLPLFEECVSAAADIRADDDSKDLQGNTQFTPRYPTYRFHADAVEEEEEEEEEEVGEEEKEGEEEEQVGEEEQEEEE
ncbi:GD24566 [Gryllus bimaculatus]|nr:GD24566 [Gryllus bimaculatus]